MQGRAASEKHVAGGSTLPGEEDLTLIVADEDWLHSRRSDTKLRSRPEGSGVSPVMKFSSTYKTATISHDFRGK